MCEFHQNLKLADITPVYKKNDILDKKNLSAYWRIATSIKNFRKNNVKIN